MLDFVLKSQAYNLNNVVRAARSEIQRRKESLLPSHSHTLLEEAAGFKLKIERLHDSLIRNYNIYKFRFDKDWEYNHGEATLAIATDTNEVRYIVSQRPMQALMKL